MGERDFFESLHFGPDGKRYSIKLIDWRENQGLTFSVEDLYQSFKARLIRELVAGLPSIPVDTDGCRTLMSPLVPSDRPLGGER